MATTVVAHDFQTAQALYQRSLQGELMEVNKDGLIRTASFGTRVVSALIGAFKGADAKDAYVSGKQREVAQAFRSMLASQPQDVSASGPRLRDRSASIDTLDGRDLSVGSGGVAAANSGDYELPTDALALQGSLSAYGQSPHETLAGRAASGSSSHDNPTYSSSEDDLPPSLTAHENPTYSSEDAAPQPGLAQSYEQAVHGAHAGRAQDAIPAYAQGNGSSVLNYSTDPSLAHLKETAHFVKAEIEQHGTDAGRALQNIGVLKTLSNANQASNGEILQALTPELKTQYDSELSRLKGERAQGAIGQKAADAAYRAASLDNPDLPVHELLNRPLFAQAPIAQRFLENAYMDKVSARHVRGEANYDAQQPSREILADRNVQRDALMAEFGSGNRDSAISKALSGLQVSAEKLRDLQGDFDDLLNPQAADVARSSAFVDGVSTAQFSAQVDALVAEFMKTAQA